MVITDAVSRLLPGVLGNPDSLTSESFSNQKPGPDLDFPQYTQPRSFKYQGKKLEVPSILLTGHHQEIAKWRSKKTTS